jgi:hypothetical protein
MYHPPDALYPGSRRPLAGCPAVCGRAEARSTTCAGGELRAYHDIMLVSSHCSDPGVCMSAVEKVALALFLAGVIAFFLWVAVWIFRK